MIIKILGIGCARCKLLENNAVRAVEQLSIDAEVVKVTDMKTIISTGKVLKVEEIIDKIKFLSN